jgi:glutathione peroxidase
VIKQFSGLAALLLLLTAAACDRNADTADKSETSDVTENQISQEAVVDYRNISFKTITGDTTSLADFDGQVVLLVNVASKCGYTPQYTDLEKLYQSLKDSGLVVIGFPANNFGEQEPGTDEDILKFCTSTYQVSFPMMSKVSVLGDDKHPLFVKLTEGSTVPGDIKWNFSKMLLDRSGNLIARYDSDVEPMSDELVGEIRKLL